MIIWKNSKFSDKRWQLKGRKPLRYKVTTDYLSEYIQFVQHSSVIFPRPILMQTYPIH